MSPSPARSLPRPVRHVPVLTDNKVEAVLSIKDCIDHVIQEHQKELDTMKGFVSGSY